MATHQSTSRLSLRAGLQYEPQVLKFGTSGRRGEVVHLTQLEIYINALAELEYLQSLPLEQGGIRKGEEFYYARDLRPSSSRFVPRQGGRGELAQAIDQAIRDAGMKPVNLGELPTPALTFFALQHGKGSMMITGSHIPFDRNGYKTNSAKGELLKKDESPVNARVEQVRHRLYAQPAAESLFNGQGLFKDGSRSLPPECLEAGEAYIRRYTDFFAGRSLAGLRLLAYQHSAVGRDLLVDILRRLGAEVIPAGRSETFVPIDTEAIDAEQLAVIQDLADEVRAKHGPIDAVVSTDGDSDRPLILGVEKDGRVRFFGGDLVGMIVAEYLGADAVVVPISCNDAVDRGALREIVEPKTRIGSPFVIATMEKARHKGRRAVCGWEANGGFLTGSDIVRDGKTLKALPTRDAVLPILGVLLAAGEKKLPVSGVFEQLPHRFSRAALLRNFPRPVSQQIIEQFSSSDPAVRDKLSTFFPAAKGFGQIVRLDHTDGVRIYFSNGDVAHVRPSGNADELRIYAVADTQARADAIASLGVAEPDGILRQMEKAVNVKTGSDASGADLQAAVAEFKARPGLLSLRGVVQSYDWGGKQFIPALLGIDNPSHHPFAELWIGAHPSAPATAHVGRSFVPLTQLAHGAAVELLGAETASCYAGHLPYLLKVLDAHKMLSIQAHPTLQQAKDGYEREESAGISLKSPHRNYKDRNHKPEVHVALTDFWMLHGFRPLEEIAATLQAVPEFAGLMPNFAQRLTHAGTDSSARAALLRDLYQSVMTMDQEKVDAILKPLIARLKSQAADNKDEAAYWVLRAAACFPLPGGHCDRGIFSIYLLNLLHLKPGQGTFQAAGTLHAYLEGVNVELMANSDNVLRGGLTPKHMDVPELMRVLDFSSGQPDILPGQPISPTETVYRTPAAEFELSRLQVSPAQSHTSGADHETDILIVLEGRATVHAASQSLDLKRGEIVLAPYGLNYTVDSPDGPAVLFKATVPKGKEIRE